MKKLLITFVFFIPFLSLSQISDNEQKEIDIYVSKLCKCANEVMNTLSPIMSNYIEILAEHGESVAEKFIIDFLTDATEEERNKFIADADLMNSKEFQAKIENCDDNSNLTTTSIAQINNASGERYIYFKNLLSNKDVCKLTNMFYNMGTKEQN